MNKKTNFKGDLGAYEIRPTDDNSSTVWSEFFDECCHSNAGAEQETEYIYYHGCGIADKVKQTKEIHILEIGFGTGLGFKLTYDRLLNSTTSFFLKFTSVELDRGLVDHFLSSNPEFNSGTNVEKEDLLYYEYQNDKLHLQILIGDARKTIPKAVTMGLLDKIDAIYQDAFSPGKNPQLWTIQWFEMLKVLSNPHTILSTYSASVNIRKSMHIAGWAVFSRKGFGPKRSCTIGRIDCETDQEFLKSWFNSPIEPLIETEFDLTIK